MYNLSIVILFCKYITDIKLHNLFSAKYIQMRALRYYTEKINSFCIISIIMVDIDLISRYVVVYDGGNYHKLPEKVVKSDAN